MEFSKFKSNIITTNLSEIKDSDLASGLHSPKAKVNYCTIQMQFFFFYNLIQTVKDSDPTLHSLKTKVPIYTIGM